jgi:UDP-N-acetylglucosamine 3-dehydrogenase
VRIGLVGAGFMGGVYLNAYANIPEAEVVGVADARAESAVWGAELVGGRPFASYDELVAAEDVEIVLAAYRSAKSRKPENVDRTSQGVGPTAH